MEKMMNLKEAAEYLGLHPETLRQKTKRGEFPHHRTGRKLGFYASELREATKINGEYHQRSCTND